MNVYFKCVHCKQKGIIGSFQNQDKDFYAEGWYIDKSHTHHEIIICGLCGTLHDVIPSLLKSPLAVFLPFLKISPYLLRGYFLLSDLYEEIVRNKTDINTKEVLRHGFNLNDKVIDYMFYKGFFAEEDSEEVRLTREEFLKKFKRKEDAIVSSKPEVRELDEHEVPFTPEIQKMANSQGATLIGLKKNGKRSETSPKSSSEDMKFKEEIKRACGKDFPISGGIGNSRENPIIIHKIIPNDYVKLEYEILRCLGAMRNVEWKLLQQTLIHHNNRKLDQLKIEVKFITKEEIITTIENYYFDITECWDISMNDLRIFQVDEYGYIKDESYDADTPFKHKDAYDIPRQIGNIDDLIFCMEWQPFAWVIYNKYFYFVEEQIPEHEKDKWTREIDNGQTPEDREAIEQWQSYLGEKEFIRQMNNTLQKWLNEDVDISEEELYSDIPLYSDAWVFLFFSDEPELVEKLDIDLIDGPYPGSDFQGAKLGISIEEANKICIENQLPIRFEKFKNERVE